MPEDPLKKIADQFASGGVQADDVGTATADPEPVDDPLLKIANAFAGSEEKASTPQSSNIAALREMERPTSRDVLEETSEEFAPGFKAQQESTGLLNSPEERLSMAISGLEPSGTLNIPPETFRGKGPREIRQFADNIALVMANKTLAKMAKIESETAPQGAQVGLPFNTEEGRFLVDRGLMEGRRPGRSGRAISTIDDPDVARRFLHGLVRTKKSPGRALSILREVTGGISSALSLPGRDPTPLEAEQAQAQAEEAGPVPRALAQLAAFVAGPARIGAQAGAKAAVLAPPAAKAAVAKAGARSGVALTGAAMAAANEPGGAFDKVTAGLTAFGLARLAPAMSDRIQGHIAGMTTKMQGPALKAATERSGVFFSEGVADAILGAGIRGGDFSNAAFDFLFGGSVGTVMQGGKFSPDALNRFVDAQVAKARARNPGIIEDVVRPLRAGQRGSVDASAGEDVAEAVGTLMAPFREIKNTLARHGDAGKQIGDKIDRGIEHSSEYRAKVIDSYDKALDITKGSFLPATLKDKSVLALQRPIKDPKTGVLLDPMTEIVEGRLKPRTAGEKEIIDSLVEYQRASWRRKYEIGTERKSAADDKDADKWERIPKEPPPVHPRIFTHEVFSAFRGGRPKVRKKLIADTAKLNGWSTRQADAWAKRMDSAFKDDGPEGVEARAQAELRREVQRMPGAIKLGGTTIPILQSNPHHWLKRFHEVSASAYGRRLAFGQGSTDSIPALRESFRQETGNDRVFTDAMRAYQGVPVVRPVAVRGTVIGEGLRATQALLGVARAGRLTGAVPGNTVEIMVGAQNAFGRFGDTFRGLLDLGLGKATGGRKGITSRQLEKGGFKTKDVTDLTINPNDPVISGIRKFSSSLRAIVSLPIEEATETVTAARARRTAMGIQKRIDTGKFSARDLADARALGMSDGEASKWLRGGMTVEESKQVSDRFRRRMVTYTTAANQNPAQISRAEHTRFTRGFLAFTRWASMRARISAKRIGVATEMLGEGVAGRTKGGRKLGRLERVRHATAGVGQATKHFFGVGAAGVANTLIASYLFEGEEGFEMRLNKLKNDPLGFFAEGVMSGSLSGPYAGLAQVMSGETDTFVERIIFPYQVAKNIYEATAGEGRLKGVPFWARMGQLGQTLAPISKVATTGALSSAFGDSEYQKTLRGATRHYFGMLRDEGVDFGRFKDPSDFSVKMRRAVKLIERGEPAEVWANKILEALGEDGKDIKNVKQSLRSRRRITGPSWTDERIQKLRSVVGDKGIRALAIQDLLLTTIADAL